MPAEATRPTPLRRRRYEPRPRHLVLAALLLVLAGLLAWRRPPAAEGRRECTADDLTLAYGALARAEQALLAPPKEGAWPAAESAFRDYRHCDEGPIRVGFTGVTCQLLSRRWGEAADVARDARKQRWLLPFLTSHLLDGCRSDDRAVIAWLAERKCPRYAKTFCGEVRRAATQQGAAQPDLP